MSTERRTATAVAVALCAPLAAILAAVAIGGAALAPTFALLFVAAPLIGRPR